MNKKKWTSLLMILALLLTLLPAPELSAMAEGDTSSDKDNGMKISKTATANDDGTYTITLEAYATGSKVISEIKKDVPTDIILVLDQSGSMKKEFSSTTEDSWESYGNQTNGNNYNLRMRNNNQNGNLYYKLSDGSYVGVSVDRTSETIKDYVEYSNVRNESCYTSRYDLYANTDEGYKKVEVKRSWNYYTYTYTRNDGTVVTKTSDEAAGNPPYTIYRWQDTYEYIYEYYYTVNGVKTIIGTQSRGEDTTFDVEFYKRLSAVTSITATALEALQRAVRNFTSAVETKAAGKDGVLGTSDDINHRIAVVGFASGDYYNDEYYNYGNTEVFIGGRQYKYGTDAQGQYANALQSMNTSTGVDNINASIRALDANGGTLTNLGLEMANGIFEKNPLQQNEKRNRVVIVFTDGAPGWSGYNSSTANSAITQANTSKNTYGATVYTVGIFSGADATSAGNQNGDETQKANWFMQQVSSNNGTPKTPSYYLSAGDSGSLNNIFQQISNQIESGGTTSTLTEESVVKDIISPQFTLPEGATASDITLETWECTGKDANGEYTWSQNADAMGAKATITSTDNSNETTTKNQVSVTGFNFSENYVGTVTENGNTTYRGNKLVIKFNVKPRDGFLGGNGVFTNSSAGIYENDEATEPVLPFEQPKTDVAIKEPTIILPDANVYLGAYFDETVNAEDLKKGTSITFGSGDSAVSLDLTKPNANWGLEEWQTEYVTIDVKVTDKDGNEVTDFEKLKDDTQYKVSVSIKPKTPKADNNGYDKDMMGTIHVFKPVLTFKDSTVEYKKATVTNPDYYAANNKGAEVWKNGNKTSTDTDVKMLGTKPELTLTYTTADGKFDDVDDLVISTEDIPVQVTVNIGEEDVTNYTTFEHQACTTACGWNHTAKDGDPAFLLHVVNVYGDLKITKTGLNQHTYTGKDEDQESAIFKVESADKTESWIVAINGNSSVTLTGLKVGSYTVTELTDWTWRYRSSTLTSTDMNSDGTFKVNGGATTTVTCTNGNHNDKWLGGDNYKNNVFAAPSPAPTTGN